jgi:hypothetical protein
MRMPTRQRHDRTKCVAVDPRKKSQEPGEPADAHGLGDAHWLRQAFAVEPPGAAQPTPRQQAAIDRLCQAIARRRLATPALVFLEMARPLNFCASQALHALTPLLALLGGGGQCGDLAEFLERRGAVEYLVERVRHLEQAPPCRGSAGKPPGDSVS